MATDELEAVKLARLRRAAINLLGEWRPEDLEVEKICLAISGCEAQEHSQ